MKKNDVEKQELRQAINKLEIVGVVKESKLNAGESDKGKYINGSLVIKAGEFTEVEVKVFVNEKTKDGNTRKVYSTLKQILDKNVSTLADGVNEEEAVKVRIWGNDNFAPQFREEMYVSESNPTEVTTRISLDLGFGNVTINDTYKPEDYKAEFDVEMFIHKIEEEEKDGEPTGRAIVKGYVPAYGGTVFPLTIVAGEIEDEDGQPYDFGEDVLNALQEGDTVRLWGEINHQVIVSKKKVGGGLGRAKTEETRTYVNELVAYGGDLIEDEDKMFDEDLIKTAVKERENKKQEILQQHNESENKKESKSRGMSNNRNHSAHSQAQRRNNNSVGVSDDDIPF
jgi:hypothetical protein